MSAAALGARFTISQKTSERLIVRVPICRKLERMKNNNHELSRKRDRK